MRSGSIKIFACVFSSILFVSSAQAELLVKACLSNASVRYGAVGAGGDAPDTSQRNQTWLSSINASACPPNADMTCPAGTVDLGIVKKAPLTDAQQSCSLASINQVGTDPNGISGCTNSNQHTFAQCYKCTVVTEHTKNCAVPGI